MIELTQEERKIITKMLLTYPVSQLHVSIEQAENIIKDIKVIINKLNPSENKIEENKEC